MPLYAANALQLPEWRARSNLMCTPNAFWVPLADLDFSAGDPVMKLTVEGGRVYAGNAASQFERAEAFTFQAAA